MKKRFKKLSHSSIAFLLTVCMLFSCLSVGMMTANAEDSYTQNPDTYDDYWNVSVKDTTFRRVWDTNLTMDVTSNRLEGDNLRIWLWKTDKDGKNEKHYGNNLNLSYQGNVTVGEVNDKNKYIDLVGAASYSTVTIRIFYDNGTKVEWNGGTPKTVTVAANVVDGQTGYGSASVTQNSVTASSVEPGTQVDFTATAKTGYSFVGWYSSADGSDNSFVTSDNPYSPKIDEDKTLYAKFETTKDEYYNVNFTAGPNGNVTATANGRTITSGTTVKWGTKVVLTAAPNDGYGFTKWTGTNTGTESLTIIVKSAVDVKAWFAANQDGEESSGGPYFRYGTNESVSSWSNIKHKNGRAYGYIENPSVGTTYYFSISDNTLGTDNIWSYNGDNKWDASSFKTDFDGFVDVGMYSFTNENERKLGTATLKNVDGITYSRIIIDLGEWKEDGFHLEYNTFRVIPVYDTDETNVDIYAKNSAYRSSDYYDYFYNKAKTVITGATNIVDHTVMNTGYAMRGDTITVKTTINSGYKDTYYVKGFSFNGVTYNLFDYHSDGIYEESFKIPDDFADDYLEITPIYYYKHESTDKNYVQFYIENYDEALQATGWGNTLFVYPYYSKQNGDSIDKVDNSFGGYPGQPVIFYGGRRFVEIPTEFTRNDTTGYIKGVTLSNGFWDIVHREYVNAVPDHKQTYDYDDFYKIYKETSDGKEVNGKEGVVDQITFVFKYRTATNNFSDGTTKTDSNYTNGNVPQPYESFTVAEKDSKFENGWEPLLDYHDRPVDLFGKQLTEEQQAKEPLLVVSDDYKITYSGYYATTWTVYALDSSTNTYKKIKEIAPSALIVTSADRLSDSTYVVVNDTRTGVPHTTDTKLADYVDEYNALREYQELPVLITYESAIENNPTYIKYFNYTDGEKYSSEVAKRNDGRWLYSYYNDKITANIRIDYKDDETSTTWLPDSFKTGTNVGEHTGATAYFTNSTPDINGLHDTSGVKILSDPNKNFTFTATKPSGYIFQGWWLEKDGIATRVTENDVLNGQSAMTSNATFVARYVKAPSGTLTINHTVSDDSTGSGKTYVAVYAYKKADDYPTRYNNGRWITSTAPHNGDFRGISDCVDNQFEIGSEYISYGSGYMFDIVLFTVPDDGYSIFNKFTESKDNYTYQIGNSFNCSKEDGGYRTDITETVDVDDLFDNQDGIIKQKYDVLSYFSELNTYNYEFKFVYPAYVKDYGDLGYVARGKVSRADFNQYMQLDNSGNLEFKPDDGNTGGADLDGGPGDFGNTSNTPKVDFLNMIAPYEDNFMTTIRWNTEAVETEYDAATHTLRAAKDLNTGEPTVIEAVTETRQVNIYFRFPYDINIKDGYQPVAGADGKVSKIVLGPNQLSPTCTEHTGYGQVFSLNDNKVYYTDERELIVDEDKIPELIEAPKVIYDGETPYIFRYWSIKAKSAEGSHKWEPVEYTRSYNYQFDYVLFQDSIVEPIYTQLTGDETVETVTPNTEIKKDEAGVTITFMENSRNQYNENNCGNITISGRTEQGDRIYTNFLVSANNVIRDGDEIVQLNQEKTDDNYEVGIVIERVAELESETNSYEENGEEVTVKNYITKDESGYKEQYGGKLRDEGDSGLSLIDGGYKEAAVKDFILHDIGNGFLKSEITLSQLNNRNRINYFYTMPNRNHIDLKVSPYQYQLYRAYAYVVDKRSGKGNEEVHISNVPVYFTIYDMGSIENYGEALNNGYIATTEEG